MGKIIEFNGMTRLDLDPDKLLENAKGELEQVMIMGITKDKMIFLATSTGDIGQNLLMMERSKRILLDPNEAVE